jgi:hypothetical protein
MEVGDGLTAPYNELERIMAALSSVAWKNWREYLAEFAPLLFR